MLEIINQQRKVQINCRDFQEFADAVNEQVPKARKKSATVAFVSDRKMRELNKSFRGKNSTTDVLSFPSENDDEPEFLSADNEYLGDIAVSLEQAQRQAAENDLDFATEIKQLILHGVLHLCGYDHETDDGEMNRKELKLRAKLQIS